MNNRLIPWILFAVAFVWLALSRGCTDPRVTEAVERARIAEDSLAVLEPKVDSLVALAARRDTVRIAVEDTIRVTVERVRVVAAVASDSLAEHVDSVGAAFLAELQAAHAEEVASLERLAEERLLWGQSWKDAAEALEAENKQLRLRGDSWQQAYNASRRESRWLKLGGIALVGLSVYQGITR